MQGMSHLDSYIWVNCDYMLMINIKYQNEQKAMNNTLNNQNITIK